MSTRQTQKPRKAETTNMFLSGRFFVGCNYWASHAGTRMWADWREDVVSKDLRQQAKAGLQVLRVFPLWPDFQPLTSLYTCAGRFVEVRHGETPLTDDESGAAGMSPSALKHFAVLADIAERNGLKLIVGLITGWMSGRLYVPPALEGHNILTDPVAILWQVRFIRAFIQRFKHHPAILAWDLGNECNCLGSVTSRAEAWVWISHMVNAIRATDSSRQVVSGMHGLKPDMAATWRIQDQAELLDVLTTHPYPSFTPHCDNDPVNTLRNGLHATAESLYYAMIGKRPCFAEELGTLGSMMCSERVAADYIRTTLFSLWAHNCHGMLWWCAYDQAHLKHAPYDWHSHERELGLFRQDRSAKPVLKEMQRFGLFLKRLPIGALPEHITQAVCILSEDQDQWGAAYSSFILAKQAQLDIEFQYADQPLKESALYLMPSVCGAQAFSRRFWLALLERVKNGATLYLSHENCMLAPFSGPFGLEVVTRERRASPVRLTLDGIEKGLTITTAAPFKLTLNPIRALVLGCEEDGNPAFTCATYGKGRIFFLSVPLESYLSNTPGCFHRDDAPPFWKIYRHIAHPLANQRVIACQHPAVGATEHPVSSDQRVVVLINYSPVPVEVPIALAKKWAIAGTWYGQKPSHGICRLERNDALVMVLRRRK